MNQQTEKIELKPCPFCGCRCPEPLEVTASANISWVVFCPDCGAKGGRHFMINLAKEQWNLRREEPIKKDFLYPYSPPFRLLFRDEQ